MTLGAVCPIVFITEVSYLVCAGLNCSRAGAGRQFLHSCQSLSCGCVVPMGIHRRVLVQTLLSVLLYNKLARCLYNQGSILSKECFSVSCSYVSSA